MTKSILTFIIYLSLSEVSLGQYVFTIADLQMLSNAKSPASINTFLKSKGYTSFKKGVENGMTSYTYTIRGSGGRTWVLDVSFSKFQKSFGAAFAFHPRSILNGLVREIEKRSFDQTDSTDTSVTYADKDSKWIISMDEMDFGDGTTTPVKLFTCSVALQAKFRQ